MPRLLTYFGLLTQDDAGKWIVRFPDVPGCSAHGKTLDAARRMAQEELRLAIAREVEVSRVSPKPSDRATIANHALARGAMIVSIRITDPLVRERPPG